MKVNTDLNRDVEVGQGSPQIMFLNIYIYKKRIFENIHSKQSVIIYQHKIECSEEVQMIYRKKYPEDFQNTTIYIIEIKMLTE